MLVSALQVGLYSEGSPNSHQEYVYELALINRISETKMVESQVTLLLGKLCLTYHVILRYISYPIHKRSCLAKAGLKINEVVFSVPMHLKESTQTAVLMESQYERKVSK